MPRNVTLPPSPAVPSVVHVGHPNGRPSGPRGGEVLRPSGGPDKIRSVLLLWLLLLLLELSSLLVLVSMFCCFVRLCYCDAVCGDVSVWGVGGVATGACAVGWFTVPLGCIVAVLCCGWWLTWADEAATGTRDPQ